jgi:hypothetical protein
MYSALKPGGRMVALCSPHYKHSSGKKEAHFKQWLDEVGAMTEDIAPGTFKESGTSIATVMIVINKPHN